MASGWKAFVAAAKAQAQLVAPQYGLDQNELAAALIANAYMESGASDTTGAGDRGYSLGRFQLNTTSGSGGHGEKLLKEGVTREQLLDDEFQAQYWAPILAKSLQAVKAQGYQG